MKVSVMGGAEFDVLSNDELSGHLRGFENSIVSRLAPRSGPKAIRRSLIKADVFGAAAPLVLSLGNVPADSMWTVVLVTVTGPDDHSVVANAVPVVYFGASSTPPNRGDLIGVGTAVPQVFFYSKETMYGHDGDELFVVVYGAVAAGTQMVATAKVHEWRPSAREELSVI